jgi:hypothetical protein
MSLHCEAATKVILKNATIKIYKKNNKQTNKFPKVCSLHHKAATMDVCVQWNGVESKKN